MNEWSKERKKGQKKERKRVDKKKDNERKKERIDERKKEKLHNAILGIILIATEKKNTVNSDIGH